MKHKLSKKQRRKRALKMRRRFAAAALILALAAAGLAVFYAPGLSMVLFGAAALVMGAEAALLCRRRALPAAVYALMGLMFAALAAGAVQVRGYVFSDAGIVPVESTVTELRLTDAWPEHLERYTAVRVLDARSATLTDYSPALHLRSLRLLDARGNPRFTEADFNAVTGALPKCEVKWSIPIAGNYYDSDVQDIDVSALSLSAGEIAALREQYPDKRFTTSVVNVLGQSLDPETTVLDLSGREAIDINEVLEALELLPEVTQVDLRGTPLSADDIAALTAARPEARFLCTFDLPFEMTTEDSVVTLPAGGYAELAAAMAFMDYMPNLQYMDARAITLTESESQSVQADPRSARLAFNFTVYGRQVSTLDTELNLDGVTLSGRDEVEQLLSRMPALKKLSLCDCGLSDQDMGALFDAHPGVKFIWWVSFGKYRLRTDATAFTTNLYANNKEHYTSETFAPLRYCTDLLYLDIGHCDLTSLENFRGLTKLRVLILADNEITDISPLAGMNDLEYVEVFLNKITDFSPLANKEKLIDLNIYYCPIADVTPLTTCKALQRLWLGQCGLSSSEINTLKQALPDCKINAKGSASTGHGWREHKRYNVIKQMNREGVYVPFS